jgi:hypothetical protein
MGGYSLKISGVAFVLAAVAGALIIRMILSVFKAWALAAGEHAGDKLPPSSNDCWSKRFGMAFAGFGGNHLLNDYWLPVIIGVAELTAYPVLMSLNRLNVIGGWIAIKTAGQWGTWTNSRTAFNRFLVGNILGLAISYLWLSRWIHVP